MLCTYLHGYPKYSIERQSDQWMRVLLEEEVDEEKEEAVPFLWFFAIRANRN